MCQCPCCAAWMHVHRFHGQPLARAHCNICKCPFRCGIATSPCIPRTAICCDTIVRRRSDPRLRPNQWFAHSMDNRSLGTIVIHVGDRWLRQRHKSWNPTDIHFHGTIVRHLGVHSWRHQRKFRHPMDNPFLDTTVIHVNDHFLRLPYTSSHTIYILHSP